MFFSRDRGRLGRLTLVSLSWMLNVERWALICKNRRRVAFEIPVPPWVLVLGDCHSGSITVLKLLNPPIFGIKPAIARCDPGAVLAMRFCHHYICTLEQRGIVWALLQHAIISNVQPRARRSLVNLKIDQSPKLIDQVDTVDTRWTYNLWMDVALRPILRIWGGLYDFTNFPASGLRDITWNNFHAVTQGLFDSLSSYG